jgi:hypothetical protein
MPKPETKRNRPNVKKPGALLAVALAALLVCGSTSLLQGVLAQQTPGAGAQSGATLSLTTSFGDKNQVAPDEQIEIRLNRAPGKAEGRLAVVINQTDVTSLFTSTGTVLRYNPQLLPLSLGESEMIVYLVSQGGQWKEAVRFPLRVTNERAVESDKKETEQEKKNEPEEKAEAKPQEQTEARKQPPENPQQAGQAKQTGDAQKGEEAKQPEADQQGEAAKQQPGDEQKAGEQKAGEQKADEQKTDATQQADGAQQADAAKPEKPPKKRLGFEKLNFIPAVTISMKSQPAQSTFPESNRPERPTFTDLNMQASLKSEMARGPFNSQTQFDFVGASFQKEALRFAELGDRALQVDLSSYLMQIQTGKVKYQSGQYSFGALRHLMNSFSSRGVMMSLPVGKRADLALTAMNGSTVVGFGNFFGLNNRKHQLLSGTLGFEVLPKRPGGFRLEAGVLDGWLLPVAGFTEGVVNDAQRSQGIGVRVLASDPSQRFKLDGGFTRSKFLNPADPLLNQNANVREVPPITRNARYLDASAEILKDIKLTKEKKLNLTFGFKHELVDPLFRSLGASTQADKASNDFSLVSTIGDVSAQFTHARFNDNLAGIPSILTSLNRANTLLIGVPLAALLGNPQKPSPLLPRVSYNFNRTHAFSEAIPINGGFEQDPASIPDQVSTNQALTADWQIQKWRLGYRLNHTFVNNQQLGSQLADQLTLVNGVGVGVAASGSLDLNLDINVESINNQEARSLDRTLRLAPTINWRMGKKSTFASNFSTTLAGDEAKTKRNRNVEFDMQWTYQFAFFENDRLRKVQGQFFIRYADRYARTRNFVIVQNDLQKTRTLNLGLSFNIF